MHHAELRYRRSLKFFEIIHALNERQGQRLSGFFDCGILGIAHIYWRNCWEVTWYDELNTEFKEVPQ